MAVVSAPRFTPFPSASLYPRKRKKVETAGKLTLSERIEIEVKKAADRAEAASKTSKVDHIAKAVKDAKGAASFLGNFFGGQA